MRRAGEVNRVRWPKEGGEQGETNQAPEILEQGGEGRRSGEGSCSRPRAPRRGAAEPRFGSESGAVAPNQRRAVVGMSGSGDERRSEMSGGTSGAERA
jgi:hypothetical protein